MDEKDMVRRIVNIKSLEDTQKLKNMNPFQEWNENMRFIASEELDRLEDEMKKIWDKVEIDQPFSLSN